MNLYKLIITILVVFAPVATSALAEEGTPIAFSIEVDGERYDEPVGHKIDEVVVAFASLMEAKATADQVWEACKRASLGESTAQVAYTDAVDAALADPNATASTDDLLTAWRTARLAKKAVCAEVVEPTEALREASMTANNTLVSMWEPVFDRLEALEKAEPEVTEDDVDALLKRIVALEENAAVSSSIVDAVVDDCAWGHPGNVVCSNPVITTAVAAVKAK